VSPNPSDPMAAAHRRCAWFHPGTASPPSTEGLKWGKTPASLIHAISQMAASCVPTSANSTGGSTRMAPTRLMTNMPKKMGLSIPPVPSAAVAWPATANAKLTAKAWRPSPRRR